MKNCTLWIEKGRKITNTEKERKNLLPKEQGRKRKEKIKKNIYGDRKEDREKEKKIKCKLTLKLG